VNVGYWGFDGYIAAGLGNSFWQGQSFLEAATINQQGEVTIDHYPEAIGSTFATDLPILHSTLNSVAGVTVPIIIGEWGTITATSDSNQQTIINNEMPTLINDTSVIGFNYWTELNTFGCSSTAGEDLITCAYATRPGWTTLKSYLSP
jgi:hypothetical protein